MLAYPTIVKNIKKKPKSVIPRALAKYPIAGIDNKVGIAYPAKFIKLFILMLIINVFY